MNLRDEVDGEEMVCEETSTVPPVSDVVRVEQSNCSRRNSRGDASNRPTENVPRLDGPLVHGIPSDMRAGRVAGYELAHDALKVSRL